MELIISEKPNAAQKLAEALADGKPIANTKNGVKYWEVTHGKQDILIASGVGHLYTVAEKKKSSTYPTYDIHWVPGWEGDKTAAHTKKYLSLIEQLAKKAKTFTVATDYDIEGEVIGLNIMKYACKQKDANRMKFSTLMKEDLRKSYAEKQKHLDWGQANAGETRHFLDWLYGINLSRALMTAIRKQGFFKILSAGRVQGPALKLIVDREKEIRAFVPEPYWQVKLNTTGPVLEAWHTGDKFWEKPEAQAIMKKAKGHDAKVSDVKARQSEVKPPTPFNLGDLQAESYRVFKMSPKETLAIAQKLYVNGATSYPRTSSQQLPKEIGYKKILQSLGHQARYKELTTAVLSTSLTPNNGKKTDAAHPAIYPTGQAPKGVDDRSVKVYDLIVKRFFATFGTPAKRETSTIMLDVNGEPFKTSGTRTVEPGWHAWYEPHVLSKDEELPKVDIGKILKVKKLERVDKETTPPNRFTPAGLVKELEKRELGTKATRADIIESLYKRGYVHEKSIEATELGIKTVDVLSKYVPEIIDEALTRHFEQEMKGIVTSEYTPEAVLKEARIELTKTLTKFNKHEKAIGKELWEAEKETQDLLNTIGPCLACKKNDLVIKRGRFGRFIACKGYPDCKATFKIPQNGAVKVTEDVCEVCKHPMIFIRKMRGAPQKLCINRDCKTKKPTDPEVKHEESEMRKHQVEKECPKCKNPLVLRKSLYGEFLGCSTFPKCKYTERLKDGPLKEDFPKEKKKK